MKKIKPGLFLISAILLIICLFRGFQGLNKKIVLEQRVSDVTLLTQIYLNATNVNSYEELLALLKRNNMALSNPIPKDKSKACYRLTVSPSANSQSTLIEETTNVNDEHLKVISYRDGSIGIQRKRE